jgi:hypothetical protein
MMMMTAIADKLANINNRNDDDNLPLSLKLKTRGKCGKT